MKSIMDIFKPAPTAAAPAVTEAPAAALPDTAAPPAAGGAAPAAVPDSEAEVSPLDAYKNLWDTAPNDAVASATDPTAGITIDPAKIAETVKGIDFAGAIDPNTQELLAQGGEGAQNAFVAALNSVSQQVFSQAMIASATLTKEAIANAAPTFDQRAETLMKHTQIAQHNVDANANLAHPSVAPMVKAIETQMAAKHPTASAKEVSDLAQAYLTEFSSHIKGAPTTSPDAATSLQAGETDWVKALGFTS